MRNGTLEKLLWALRIRFLRNMLVLTVAVSVVFPLAVRYGVYPVFVDFALDDLQKEALINTRELAEIASVEPSGGSFSSLFSDIVRDPARIGSHHPINKIKFFSASGVILHSTDPAEIGNQNQHAYFRDIVAMGRTYVNLVRKAGRTADGETTRYDIAETYVPVMEDGKFTGAFEIYYDVSEEIAQLSRLTIWSTAGVGAIGLCLLAAVLWLMVRAAESIHLRDIAEAARRESEAIFRGAFANTDVGMTLISADRAIRLYNPAICEILGYGEEEFADIPLSELSHPEDKDKALEAVIAGEVEKVAIDKRYRHKDGRYIWCHLSSSAVRDGGRVRYAVTMVQDISDRKRFEEQLSRMANYDGLTGIPNRHLGRDRLIGALSRAHRDKTKTAVMFIDLDGFKEVNDDLGHEAGDSVLKQAARRLGGCVRETDTVSRFGGDEFTIIVTDVRQKEALKKLAEKVLAAFAEPFAVKGEPCRVGASIGIAFYPDDAENPDALIKSADAAMYSVKDTGKGGYRFAGDAAHEVA